MSTPAKPKRLPIGIQTLSIIMEKEMVYVDKTPYVDRLANTGGMRYFLARPRRFGKSLFVDTLQQAYEGRRELFEGLYLQNHWNWDKPHPVLKFDFAGGMVKSRRELDDKIHAKIDQLSESFQMDINLDDVSDRFTGLIRTLKEQFGRKVVLLIDEYDKPLLDNITDISIFSGINNLKDLTLDPNYAAICGYTQLELEEYFALHLKGVDKEELKRWYNGYNFLGERVYNPF